MSSTIQAYSHLVSTWEVYPRLYYFSGRFKDFLQRFKRIISPLPKDVHDENLLVCANDLNDFLEKDFNIIVFGKVDLSPDELFVSTQYVEDTKHMPVSPCADVIVCFTKVDALGQGGAEEIAEIFDYLEATGRSRDILTASFIIACSTNTPVSDEDMGYFREEIRLKAEVSLSIFLDTNNVIISTGNCDIKSRISYIYEQRIIEMFLRIRSFLGFFVTNTRQIKHNQTSVLKQLSVRLAILGFLRNGFNLSDITCQERNRKSFLNQVILRLARHVRCTIIGFVASKYTLPTWLCTRLLNAIEFEDVLIKSVSNKTSYMLCKLVHSYKSSNIFIQNVKYCATGHESKMWKPACYFILCFIQRDFEDASSKAEKKMSLMKSLSVTMGKMIYEIDGYLKQTIVKHNQYTQRETTMAIPDSLRHDVLALKGVYGMGTIYGVIEIHLDEDSLDKDSDLTTLSHRLAVLMREHHLHNSYAIKHIKR